MVSWAAFYRVKVVGKEVSVPSLAFLSVEAPSRLKTQEKTLENEVPTVNPRLVPQF